MTKVKFGCSGDELLGLRLRPGMAVSKARQEVFRYLAANRPGLASHKDQCLLIQGTEQLPDSARCPVGELQLVLGAEAEVQEPPADRPPVVIDCGSRVWRAGFAGQRSPATFPAMLGYPSGNTQLVCPLSSARDRYVGREVTERLGRLTIKYPVSDPAGDADFDGIEALLRYSFHDVLQTEPSEHPVLLTESWDNPKSRRERLTQMMFETFNVPSFMLVKEPVMGLYASGSGSGLVVTTGATRSCAVPVHEGFLVQQAAISAHVGGELVTDRLSHLLRENHDYHHNNTLKDLYRVERMEEAICYVGAKPESEKCKEQLLTLPDGKDISVCRERFEAPEVLFSPQLAHRPDVPGLQELVHRSITAADIDLRRSLSQNIWLVGGTAELPGLPQRLQCEVAELLPLMRPRVRQTTFCSPQDAAWCGGSIFAALDNSLVTWIDRADYKDCGESIVHRMCF